MLLYEASLGCWWGEKHHCTFCGLNGTTMKFRAGGAGALVLIVTGTPYAPGLDVVTGDLLRQAGVREVRIRETVGADDGLLHFLRFLREAASHGTDVVWVGAGDLGCDTRFLYHLPPRAGDPSWKSPPAFIGLVRSGLIISNGRDALCLPYRLRRWPIPCTAI